MALYEEPRDKRLCDFTFAAVIAANDRLVERETAGRWIGSYHQFPKLVASKDKRWPSFHESFMGDGPTDFTEPFSFKTPAEEREIEVKTIPEMRALIDYVRANDELNLRLSHGYEGLAADESYSEISAALFALKILDRARHLPTELSDDGLMDLYLEREASLLAEKLPVEILVPVVLTPFEFDGRREIAPGVCIEKMDDATQLARIPSRQSFGGPNTFVLESATHALVFTSYEITANVDWVQRIYDLNFYPMEQVDTFFQALAVVADLPTGYGQVLLRPLGWAESWRADLPPLIRAKSFRRYPMWFENGRWNDEVEPVASDALNKAGSMMAALSDGPDAARLAARRLQSALLRDREDDTVIDICIGLEGLFGDRAAEIVHKLSLRVAAVFAAEQLDSPIPTRDIFRAMKHLYDLRSRLVHGDEAKAQSRRVFTDSEDNRHWTHELARAFLRGSIAAVLDKPGYIQPGAIEEKLIVAALVGDQVPVDVAQDEEQPAT